MYRSRNKGRHLKRYSAAKKKTGNSPSALLILCIAIVSFVIGGAAVFGLYRVFNDGESENTEYIKVVDPEDLVGDDKNSFKTAKPKTDGSKPLVCIDPGHGFVDIGTTGTFIAGKTEAQINLEFSLKLKKRLIDRGFDVILTHDGKEIPVGYDYDNNNHFSANDANASTPTSERRDFAMSKNPDCFISIHCDSFSNPLVSGMRIYYSTDNTSASSVIDKIVTAMTPITNEYPNTTAKKFPKPTEEAYAVTKKWGSTPAFLVELGFITNAEDAECLLSEAWQEKTAFAIAKGLMESFS